MIEHNGSCLILEIVVQNHDLKSRPAFSTAFTANRSYHLGPSIRNVRDTLVQASQMFRFAAFLCFALLQIAYLNMIYFWTDSESCEWFLQKAK